MAEFMNDTSPLAYESSARICKVAGRFLVFDRHAVALLRRTRSISGTLVGTTPQQPTQNVFLALPLELRSEEVEALLEQGVAYVDDISIPPIAPLSVARNQSPWKVYVDSFRWRKLAISQSFTGRKFNKHNTRCHDLRQSSLSMATSRLSTPDTADGQRDIETQGCTPSTSTNMYIWGLTPSSMVGRIVRSSEPGLPTARARCHLFYRTLEIEGLYLTPGLRFGVQHSVYPGDPLRFHAHFMANEYEWNSTIPVLDIVSGGRLATAVKKALILSSQDGPSNPQSFSIEWASI